MAVQRDVLEQIVGMNIKITESFMINNKTKVMTEMDRLSTFIRDNIAAVPKELKDALTELKMRIDTIFKKIINNSISLADAKKQYGEGYALAQRDVRETSEELRRNWEL